MNTFFGIIKKISYTLGWIGFGLTVVMSLMYLIDVLGRLLLNSQMKGTFELAQFMLCLISFSAFSLAQVTRNHIHVGFIVRHFPAKLKYAVAALSFALCTMMGVIITYCLFYMSTTLAGSKLTSVLGLPYGPIYIAAGVFMAFFTIVLFSDILRSIMAFAGNEDCRREIDRVYQ